MNEAVTLEVADQIATIILNRPDRLNAIDVRLAQSLVRQIKAVALDAAVQGVIITGSGRAFCAGGDIVAMREFIDRDEPGAARQVLEAGRDVAVALRRMPKPVIAAVNGAAMGAGASLALACDVRIASEDAVFGLPFTRLGLHPDWGATYFLPRIVGAGRAMELILSGRTADAVEAERLGVFTRVVPAAALMDSARALASALIQLPADAVVLAKQSVEHSLHSTLEDVLDREVEQQLRRFESAGARQAIVAFTSKGEKRS